LNSSIGLKDLMRINRYNKSPSLENEGLLLFRLYLYLNLNQCYVPVFGRDIAGILFSVDKIRALV